MASGHRGVLVRFPADLVDAVEAAAAVTGRTSAEQMNWWIALGREYDHVTSGDHPNRR